MKVRIREKQIESGISYCIQVKRVLFWKTITDTNVLDDAIKIVDDLKKMDKVNNPQVEQVVMSGWMVRNQFRSGIGHKLYVYSDKPIYKKDNNGFYVYAKPKLSDPKIVTKYISRYLGRPVIASSRIDNYDGEEKEPEVAYKGSFNIRISPELHKRLIIYTTAHQMSLNRYIEETLENSPAAL